MRRGYAIGIACCVALVSATQEHAPPPERLLTAKAAHLVNESNDLKAYDKFYQELKKWNRFQIVSRPDAEIVMVLTTGLSTLMNGTTIPTLELKILDAATDETLWSDRTDKWVSSGHAPSKLVSNLRKRFPKK